jgi:hypothetical protein
MAENTINISRNVAVARVAVHEEDQKQSNACSPWRNPRRFHAIDPPRMILSLLFNHFGLPQSKLKVHHRAVPIGRGRIGTLPGIARSEMRRQPHFWGRGRLLLTAAIQPTTWFSRRDAVAIYSGFVARFQPRIWSRTF